MEIIISVIIFIVSYVFYHPYERYRELKYKISYNLHYYGNIYGTLTDKDISDEFKEKCKVGFDKLRECGMELKAFIDVVPYIHPFIPDKGDLHEVASCLIGLSNMSDSYNIKHNVACNEKIIKILGLYKSK